ncbi:hypothetical protein B1F79_03360 [Coxiella-like endosymbiont of Rhipicephalus sanguineus]|nr:hypothetical protein [Coxiella-like endosymbiont of Rhipicephalus sanguineus]
MFIDLLRKIHFATKILKNATILKSTLNLNGDKKPAIQKNSEQVWGNKFIKIILLKLKHIVWIFQRLIIHITTWKRSPRKNS